MDKNKLERLKRILQDAEKNPRQARQDAKEFLKTIDQEELVMAEQQLISEGIEHESLKSLCAAHIELMNEQLRFDMLKLSVDHPIKILMSEHEKILEFIDRLENMQQNLQDINSEEYEELKSIINHLLDAEKHHLREEKVLFPALERHGIYGPPQIMLDEHKELEALEKNLANTLTNLNDLKKSTKIFNRNADKLIFMLRDHIFKENNILYPAALKAIKEPDIWLEIRRECDKIGYCCFTPKHTKNQKTA